MNADRLLAHYEKIADAPDAIGRLRRFVLDLAVRGKLTDYELKKDEVTTLGQIAEFIMGQAPPGNSYNERGEGTVFVKVGEFGERFPEHRAWTTQPLKFAREGDVLICVVGATIGKLNLGIECAIGRSVAAIRPAADVDQVFLFYSLMPFTLRLREDARGTAQGVISRPDLNKIAIWLPPLTEQRRIVAKVDELMALCDRLEAARAAREATRDRLTAASLARLNAPDPQTFRDDARFALDNFPALTARADQIKQLRQTILNLAVRGKLVPQDASDEPASELLKDISQTRKKLYAEKRIPKPKELPSIDKLDLPFAMPSGWAWSMLGNLCYQVSDGPHFSPQYVPAEEGVPFLSARNIRLGSFDLSTVKHVSRADHEEFCKRIRPEKDDIIYTKGGTTGIAKVNDLDFEFSVWVHLAVLRIEKKRLYPRYVELALNSPHCYAQSQQYTQGTSNFDLGLTRMIKITVPLPPLAEQRRIVAKVDELMALCDRLEASLATADDTRRRLLEALLGETLAPADARELEAAE